MNIIFKSVNWMQGMSVSSAHFIATENYLMERLMLTTEALQGKFAYGLLPQKEDSNEMRLRIEGKGDGARLVLDLYQGITKGGCLVDITQSQSVTCECKPTVDHAEYGWDIVLSVSPFDRRPCGDPNMMEEPPRYPFVDPIYKLSIMERDKDYVNEYGPYDVVVGLLRKKDGEFKLDNNYIPPSLSMSSDIRLKRYMNQFSQSVNLMKSVLGVILDKAYSPNSNKTQVLENTLSFCKEILRSLSDVEFRWRSLGFMLTPYQVAEIFGGMANSVLISFSFMSKLSKDEMMKYFYEWNGVAPSAFEQIFVDVASKVFCQNRIDASMSSIHDMLKLLEDLFVNLSKLDYVGQRKESMVISVSSAKEDSDSSKSSWLL